MNKNLVFFMSVVFLIPSMPSSEAATDYSATRVVSNLSLDSRNNAGELILSLNEFIPKSRHSLTFEMPSKEIFSYSSEFEINNFRQKDHVIRFDYKLPTSLDWSEIQPQLFFTILDDRGTSVIKLFGTPLDFPKMIDFKETPSEFPQGILITATVNTGSYAIASKSRKLLFFRKSSSAQFAFKKLDDDRKLTLSSGIAKYSYFVAEFDNTSWSNGKWIFLDSNFRDIGIVSTFESFGKIEMAEAHDIEISPIGNPVVMSYVEKKN